MRATLAPSPNLPRLLLQNWDKWTVMTFHEQLHGEIGDLSEVSKMKFFVCFTYIRIEQDIRRQI